MSTARPDGERLIDALSVRGNRVVLVEERMKVRLHDEDVRGVGSGIRTRHGDLAEIVDEELLPEQLYVFSQRIVFVDEILKRMHFATDNGKARCVQQHLLSAARGCGCGYVGPMTDARARLGHHLPMEKLMMLWDETDDLMAIAPRMLTAVAAVALIIAAAFIDRLWAL
jgi:hypothetical protein